ncbi:MAG TPA: protein translocase subunit SecD [Polyangiaceae bacterium]|nr:protein translocase subunit SecD [Polyangiaceae bacterium]
MVEHYLAYTFGALALLLVIVGYLQRSRRYLSWMAALCWIGAATAAYHDGFWALVIFAVLGAWAIITSLNAVDNGWRMRAGLVLSTAVIGGIVMWPTLHAMSDGKIPLPEYIKKHVEFKLVKGLDLQGGLRLVYTVDVGEAIRDRRDRRYEDMRIELAKLFDLHSGDERPTEETYTKLRELVDVAASRTTPDLVTLDIKPNADPAKIDARFLGVFSPDMTFSRSGDGRHYEFRIKESAQSEVRGTAVSQAKEIILRRVDELGLREAAVSTRDEDIIIEVPGQDESTFDEIREIIGQTARLEFKLLDDENEFLTKLSQDTSTQLPTGIEFRAESVPVGQDAEGEPLRKRSTYLVVEAQEGETSKESLKRLKDYVATLDVPQDREFGFEIERVGDPDTGQEKEIGWRTYLLRSRAEITGDMIRDAVATPDQGQSSLGGWYVALTFTDAGGTVFERITGANIKRRFAIILDDRIESAPVIQGRIPGGHASITMGSGEPQKQLQDSRKLELVLRSGALPAPITPSNEQHIGPSLGESSIHSSVRAALVGSIVVLAFMVLYYKRAGIIADIAVLFNLLLQLAVLASFGASMTLPGIAGLALTIGMSVDANVLINERIRDELREGKSPRAAVEIGYGRALSAIIDGHVTTLISAVVLAQFGTGPIKGFAVTLLVGVLVSIYTGVVVTRLMFDFWVRRMDRTAKLDIG